ncbi:phosphatidylinositol 4-kinase [Stylonychia lemnae]|uniref:Phosphatidylinositol 4-kinase n=1 Tax=Stylonychia lemnae TaxID=5949 RepID=A0A078A8X2_STYLE|nr:phosphatidylinositol 4-kinase [Stylonychia lemnae]|eukprot:CDW78326.1 phosphatidylinositol 4-kinase [Stylonychia lemnae]
MKNFQNKDSDSQYLKISYIIELLDQFQINYDKDSVFKVRAEVTEHLMTQSQEIHNSTKDYQDLDVATKIQSILPDFEQKETYQLTEMIKGENTDQQDQQLIHNNLNIFNGKIDNNQEYIKFSQDLNAMSTQLLELTQSILNEKIQENKIKQLKDPIDQIRKLLKQLKGIISTHSLRVLDESDTNNNQTKGSQIQSNSNSSDSKQNKDQSSGDEQVGEFGGIANKILPAYVGVIVGIVLLILSFYLLRRVISRYRSQRLEEQLNLQRVDQLTSDLQRIRPINLDTQRLNSLQKVTELAPQKCFKDLNENQYNMAQCPICLENFKQEDKIRITQCHHVMHSCCLIEWAGKQLELTARQLSFSHPFCPNCKFDLTTDKQIKYQNYQEFRLQINNFEGLHNQNTFNTDVINQLSLRVGDENSAQNLADENSTRRNHEQFIDQYLLEEHEENIQQEQDINNGLPDQVYRLAVI